MPDSIPHPVDDETALEDVLAFLDSPPEAGSTEDARFGERLRQVIAASIPAAEDEDQEDTPRLSLDADLRRRLEALASRRAADHPFGDHPDGIGPTLGMDLRPTASRRDP
ncbi:hypothetical protein B7G68_00350 [Caulobacter segnis]|uniref:Uncharacterized protein n=2 Tax=Caulobacter segnis TaxID=88688 RepID=D5VDP6_CAUST|nr:hypothetical protein [Caulobacter segnis]ADG08596.1 hypothetical protein Cseg_0067 [Caulobacter segnis ATCC 21756]AVQ00448.1 hypothetical protein B7G68_00350 [Caulobacter segnis]